MAWNIVVTVVLLSLPPREVHLQRTNRSVDAAPDPQSGDNIHKPM